MNGVTIRLIQHLERFVDGKDVSVEWAKNAEAILDEFVEADDVLDEIQEHLSLYRPEGGPHLYDRNQMDQFCRRIIPMLKKRSTS
jgi:hypothetical protein